jgi:hypothetical protein
VGSGALASWSSCAKSASSPFIFQFPAANFRRIPAPNDHSCNMGAHHWHLGAKVKMRCAACGGGPFDWV